jgi:hypothetical protein
MERAVALHRRNERFKPKEYKRYIVVRNQYRKDCVRLVFRAERKSGTSRDCQRAIMPTEGVWRVLVDRRCELQAVGTASGYPEMACATGSVCTALALAACLSLVSLIPAPGNKATTELEPAAPAVTDAASQPRPTASCLRPPRQTSKDDEKNHALDLEAWHRIVGG